MEGSRTTEVSEGCCRFGCKRWLVFLTAWLSMAIDVGFIFSSGALFVEYMNTFQVNRSQASLVQSVMMAVRFGSGVISGAIVQRFGTLKAGLFGSSIATVGFVISFFATSIYHLVFSMGVLIAIGSSCLFISSSTAVGRHFSGKTGLILMSIQTAGGGLGGMLYPFILKHFNSAYGLKGSLLLMGGFYMQLIPASLLWTDCRKDTNTHSTDVSSQTSDSEEISELIKDEDNNSKNLMSSKLIEYEIERKDNHECNILIERQIHVTDASNIPPKSKDIDTVENINEESAFENLKHLVTTPSFALFAAGLGIAYPSLGIVFIFIVDLFMDAGLTKDQASLGLFLIHMFSILGRLLPGIIMQSKHVATLSVPIVAATMTSVSMAGLAYANVSELCLFLCCFIGIPYGMFVSVFSVTPLKLVGISRLSNAIGVLFTLNGLGTALAGPISGMLRDSLGSYRIPFLMAASTLLAGGLLFCISLYLRKKSKRYVTESNLC